MKSFFKFLLKLAAKLIAAVGVLFAIYILNADSKLIEVIYDLLGKYHANKKVEIKI